MQNEPLQSLIITTLFDLFADTNEKVRQTVVNALGEIGKKDARKILPLFEQALFDTHHSVRNAVIGSLKKMGEVNPKPVFAFSKKYIKHHDAEVRRQAIHGVELRGRTHPTDVLPLLKEMQHEKNKRVRNMVIHVIGQISYKEGCLEKNSVQNRWMRQKNISLKILVYFPHMTKDKKRCEWAETNEINHRYHDTEWGVPVHDDTKLFEMLILEGAQAGLSWTTILKKRENYVKAFDLFNVKKIAQYDSAKITSLLSDNGIIRNKLKIASAIQNAKAFLAIQKEFSNFDTYIWQFVNNKPIKNSLKNLSEYPTKTKEAEAMSGGLLKRGFKFVGPTICYAFMQAVGMVNDHEVQCFRYNEV